MDLQVLKQDLHEKCLQIVSDRMEILQSEIAAAQAAANEDTKSSAGDKYETGRAMMMLEKEKLSSQLSENQKIRKALDLIDPSKSLDRIELGALIQASGQLYYLAASLGQIEIQNQTVFVISSLAPIGQALLGAKKGDKAIFMGRELSVESFF